MYTQDNIFTKIIKLEIPCSKIYESTYSLSFYDINPIAKIHALVIPKGKYIFMVRCLWTERMKVKRVRNNSRKNMNWSLQV